LNDAAVEGLARRSGSERFAWDAYRRFVQMYADVVLGLKAERETGHDPFDDVLDRTKRARGIASDTELTAEDLAKIVARFKAIVRERTRKPFPEDPKAQLWGAIGAVFRSWDNERAVAYRALNKIPDDWGTAVNVVAMVTNHGPTSGTGVAFTRDPSTEEKRFWRGPHERKARTSWPARGRAARRDVARESPRVEGLNRVRSSSSATLRHAGRRVHDRGRTPVDLQCRVGKRTGIAAVGSPSTWSGRSGSRRRLSCASILLARQLLQPVFAPEELAAAKKDGGS
jgi:pyruvate,orthophosphate dikinase